MYYGHAIGVSKKKTFISHDMKYDPLSASEIVMLNINFVTRRSAVVKVEYPP